MYGINGGGKVENKEVIDGWRKIILGGKEVKIVECTECGGGGFSGCGTGYNDVCDNCGGQGEHPG